MRARRPNGFGLSDYGIERFEHLWCETDTPRVAISAILAQDFGVDLDVEQVTSFASRRGWKRPLEMRDGVSRLVREQELLEALALRAVTRTRAEREGPDRVKKSELRFPVPVEGYRMGGVS